MLKVKEQKRIRRHHKIRARISGSSKRPRLVVSRSLNNIFAQLIDDTSSKTIVSASTLKGKKSAVTVESAKKVGQEIAKLAKAKKLSKCVFDRNGYKYHGKIKAVAEGAIENGLKI